MNKIFVAAALLMLMVGATYAQDKSVPSKLRTARNSYAKGMQTMQAERNDEVRKLTRKYISVLEKVKVKYTKKGDLEAAVAVKKEIEALKEILKSGE